MIIYMKKTSSLFIGTRKQTKESHPFCIPADVENTGCVSKTKLPGIHVDALNNKQNKDLDDKW